MNEYLLTAIICAAIYFLLGEIVAWYESNHPLTLDDDPWLTFVRLFWPVVIALAMRNKVGEILDSRIQAKHKKKEV